MSEDYGEFSVDEDTIDQLERAAISSPLNSRFHLGGFEDEIDELNASQYALAQADINSLIGQVGGGRRRQFSASPMPVTPTQLRTKVIPTAKAGVPTAHSIVQRSNLLPENSKELPPTNLYSIPPGPPSS
jgi:hypothetical protein